MTGGGGAGSELCGKREEGGGWGLSGEINTHFPHLGLWLKEKEPVLEQRGEILRWEQAAGLSTSWNTAPLPVPPPAGVRDPAAGRALQGWARDVPGLW